MGHGTGVGLARRVVVAALSGALLSIVGAVEAGAQSGVNGGRLRLAGSIDVPSVYVFRGFVQERDPEVTIQPSAEASASLGGLRVRLGTWHSLQTGSSGSNGPTARQHYEERFYTGVGVAVGGGYTVDATYTAYTSPNIIFDTRQELGLRVSGERGFRPYGLVAFELRGAADGTDDGTGTYVELGAAPSLALGALRATASMPVRLGLSLKDYYQGFGADERFGFFDIGGMIAVPLSRSGGVGAWTVRGGAQVYFLGDTARISNDGESSKVVATIGLSLEY